ncbi:LexA repressor [compost metagenome]
MKTVTKQLTKRQAEAFELIKGYITTKGYAPSITEVADLLKLKSRSTAHALVKKLVQKGYLTKTDYVVRTLRLVEQKNQMDIRFCFLIKSEVGMAYDTETGKATASYTEVAFKNAIKAPADYAAMQQSVRNAVAAQLATKVDFVIPISTQEYDANSEQG